jgi:hypothetical protein
LSKSDENITAKWKRNILRRIFGTVKGNGVWRIGTNQELKNLYIEPDIISKIRKGRLGWLEHVERTSEERTLEKVLKNIPEGKSLEKPRKK